VTKAPALDYYKFHQEITAEFLNSDKIGTAKIYKETLSSLKKFIRTTQAYLNKLPNKKLNKIIDDLFENSKYF